eukprot:TRINITY_DN17808_c0_g1_i3.p1 TRINITY_DN17808_c0_g1~~TRINITY_DN17808_c0_g1_i3.p1  ORF type:complete len:250 (+),score=30.63 TRINITY_DN17808_c0_g1_i3:87-836(+)
MATLIGKTKEITSNTIGNLTSYLQYLSSSASDTKELLSKTVAYVTNHASEDVSLLVAILPRLIDFLKAPEMENLVRSLVDALQKFMEVLQSDEVQIITRASLQILRSRELAEVLAKLSSALMQVWNVLNNEETSQLRAQIELFAGKLGSIFLNQMASEENKDGPPVEEARASPAPSMAMAANIERWSPVLRMLESLEDRQILTEEECVRLRRLVRKQSFQLYVIYDVYHQNEVRFVKYVREILAELPPG